MQFIVFVRYPAESAFFKTCIWSIFKEPRDWSSEENVLEMVLFEVLLVYHFTVAATLLIFTVACDFRAVGFQGWLGAREGGWE